MPNVIVPIVEGQGEVEAVSLLIRRILEDLGEHDVLVDYPKRVSRGRVLSDLGTFLRYAAMGQGCLGAIVIVDADEECPRDLATRLSEQAQIAGTDLSVVIVCPKVEYEAWFIASIETIRGRPLGHRRVVIDSGTECPTEVESIRGAKEWLSGKMPRNMAYKPSQDQAPMTYHIDFELARRNSRSFRRLYHAIEELIAALYLGSPTVTPR